MTSFGSHALTAFLAAPPTPPPGKGAEWGKAAPIGLLILVLLGIALYLLIKSMNKHMRKVSAVTSFDTAVDGPPAPSTGAADSVDGGSSGERRPRPDAPTVAPDP